MHEPFKQQHSTGDNVHLHLELSLYLSSHDLGSEDKDKPAVWTCLMKMFETDLDLDTLLRILDVFQRCINIECHHQARCKAQRIVRLPCGLYDGGCGPVDLLRGEEMRIQTREQTFHWCKNSSVYVSFHLIRQLELQQATLSERGLQDLHQFCWFTARQSRHQLQQLIHKTVLEVRQLCQE